MSSKERLQRQEPTSFFFCGTDGDKRGYCDRLAIDLYLDDKVNVLEKLSGRVRRVLFDEDDIASRLQLSDWLRVVKSWEEFTAIAMEGRQ